jgi:hypothetical protein
MPQTTHSDIEAGNDPGMCYCYCTRKFNTSHSEIMTIADGSDGNRDRPQSISNRPLQREFNFGDSSGPLFSMYSKVAEEEDNKMVDRWQKDADGILIFVSPCIIIHTSLRLKWSRLVYSLLQSLRSFL